MHQTYRNGEPSPPSKLKRIKRITAERIVKAMIARVERYNDDKTRLMTIEEIRIFGSYLTDSKTLGDIDVAFKLGHKPGWSVEAILKQARKEAPLSSDYSDLLYWPERNARRCIRNSSAYVHMQDMGSLERLKCPAKTIYKRDS